MKILGLLILVITSGLTMANEENYQISENYYGEKIVYIDGLFGEGEKKYILRASRGPKWGTDVEFVSKLVGGDFAERARNWNEVEQPTRECPHFTHEDFVNSMESFKYEIRWKAVKNASGKGRSKFYIINVDFILRPNEYKECRYLGITEEYVIRNPQNKNEEPEYLGLLVKTLERN